MKRKYKIGHEINWTGDRSLLRRVKEENNRATGESTRGKGGHDDRKRPHRQGKNSLLRLVQGHRGRKGKNSPG